MASKFLVKSFSSLQDRIKTTLFRRCHCQRYNYTHNPSSRFFHEYHRKYFPTRGDPSTSTRSLKLFPKTNICDERDPPFLLPSTFLPYPEMQMRTTIRRGFHTDSAKNSEGGGGGAGKNVKIKYSIVPREKSMIISRFLLNHYHYQEPITMALGMDIAEVDGWFKRYLRSYMFASVQDVSVEAIDGKARKRVGVLSAVILDPSRSWPILDTYLKDSQKHRVNYEMNEFYDKLERGFDPKYMKDENGKPKYPKVYELMFLSVHPQYQSLGISGHMVKLSQSLAQNINGCRISYVVCTSEYSYRLMKNLGFETVNEIAYKDYVNSKGQKIFEGKDQILGPHTKCRAMTKEMKDLYK